jgi:predicted O-methyltransferase YrrM
MRDGIQGQGLNQLMGWAKNLLGENIKIIEIGSYAGASTEIIARAFPEGIIQAVDPWEKYIEDCSIYDIEKQGIELKEAEEIFDKLIKKYENVKKSKTSSLNFSESIENESMDLVYIDGNHQYSSVKEDILTWLPKIKIRGIISGHDFGWASVKRAIDEVFKKSPDQIFPDYSWAFIKG